MKDVHLNKLDASQRRLLQYGVILILVLFLVVYFFVNWKDTSPVGKNKVYLEDNQLHIFDDTYTFNGYPDRILVHYPYFLLIQANKPLTTIYNLESQQKEKEINDILLDYYDENIVYNRKETYFNDKNLGQYCDVAFIKDSDEILCITKQSRNFVDNRLISINPEMPNLWKRVYESDNLLTSVSVINNNLYVGEINFEAKQNYLTVNEQVTPVEIPVNMVYEMGGKPYLVSFKSELNDNTQSYYLIENGRIMKQEGNRIYFFK